MSRPEAIDLALTLRPLHEDDDPVEWMRWVRETDELSDFDRKLILTATADDFRAYALAGEAELDQRQDGIDAMDAVLELGERWSVPGGTIGDAVERCRVEGTPDEHARWVALNEAIAPGGIFTVAVDG